jgi:signal transduction histidine kinase
MCDPTGLVQILANLLTNAAKYTGDDGRIFLSVTADESEAVFRIRDTGIGVAPEMLTRVFDLFTQVPEVIDRSEGGVGIGLAIVDHLVRLHRGTIQALSEGYGKGTEFVVRLPSVTIRRG